MITARIGGAISSAIQLHQGSVSIIAAGVLIVRRRTVLRTLREKTSDPASLARLVVIVEAILHQLGNSCLRAVIVMGLNDEPVPLALGRHAVGGATDVAEVGEGGECLLSVGAIDVVRELFGFAGARMR